MPSCAGRDTAGSTSIKHYGARDGVLGVERSEVLDCFLRELNKGAIMSNCQ